MPTLYQVHAHMCVLLMFRLQMQFLYCIKIENLESCEIQPTRVDTHTQLLYSLLFPVTLPDSYYYVVPHYYVCSSVSQGVVWERFSPECAQSLVRADWDEGRQCLVLGDRDMVSLGSMMPRFPFKLCALCISKDMHAVTSRQ